MTPKEANLYLDSFINYEKSLHTISHVDFKLDRMIKLLELLGNPQKQLKVIHVAGSKGKGSTCAMTAHILKEAGYKTGLYTSPHIHDRKERIRVLRKDNLEQSDELFNDTVKDEELAKIVEAIKPTIDEFKETKDYGRLTFYELFTAIALIHFNQSNTDVVVLETGLGGRLDATNAVDSIVCALTPISLEHTNILGNTIRKIAEEKSYIIKDNNQKVVVAPQSEEAREVIDKQCWLCEIEPIWIEDSISAYENLNVSLPGEHQIINAATAIEIVKQLDGFNITNDDIAQGLKDVVWPLRFETIESQPKIILDAAHNEASIKVLIETYRKCGLPENPTIIFGASNDKDIEKMCRLLNQFSNNIIVTEANHPRAHKFTDEELTKMLRENTFKKVSTVEEALESAMSTSDVVVVTGSLFVAAEVRERLCTSIKV